MPNESNISIIIPAKNEARSLKTLLPSIKSICSEAEIIVVNDGSSDSTTKICEKQNVICIEHPYSTGNGAAIKTGARHATKDIIVTMDADGQHRPEDIPKLLDKLQEGYDMAVGARSMQSQASKRRLLGNILYNKLASIVVNQKVHDLTSGFRAVNSKKFKEFLHLLPNGFSYPTTITMAFFRNGYAIAYVPIAAKKREGKSHIKLFKDGMRFFVIIIKIAALYSPLKVFVPISIFLFFLALVNYTYTYFTFRGFTNMSALLMIVSVIVFFMGLLAEQISVLIYASAQKYNK